MNQHRRVYALSLALILVTTGAVVEGCGDDDVVADEDAGSFDAGGGLDGTAQGDGSTDGGGPRLGCGDSTGTPARMLLSMNNATTSELVAFDIDGRKVDGRYSYPSYIGLTSSMGTDPYLLQQENDVVARLDPRRPWEVVSSWSVRGDDRPDGGKANASPASIAVHDCRLGYVVRYNRNRIAVIDTSRVSDGGAPQSFVDLSSLVQPNDHDGLVDAIGAIHVASKNRVYLLLANMDLKKVALDGYTALCADTKPTIAALDATTGALVSLGGTGPGGSIALGGYNPGLAGSFWYDATRDRLLVLEAGCNTELADAGAGAIQRRRIEEVDLATGQVKTLLSLDGEGFPSGMVFIDGKRAAVAFFGQAYFWDPGQTALGPEIPGGLEFFSHDGRGSVVGTRSTYLGDGGKGPLELVSVPFSDAGVDASSVVKLGENPFTDNTGFVSGVEVWPHP